MYVCVYEVEGGRLGWLAHELWEIYDSYAESSMLMVLSMPEWRLSTYIDADNTVIQF
jgi:hypothetical protein